MQCFLHEESKNQLFLSYCTCLPKFGCRTTKPQKSMWHYMENENFLFLCVLHSLNFSNPKMKSCSFSISSQFNFKNGHFLKPSNRQNGNFNIHKQMIIQMIFMASCIEEIYLKVLDKQASWTYVRLIFELFLVISWLWFALDHLRCWEDWC